MFIILSLLIFLAIMVLTSLVPCHTGRPARKIAYVTWSLIGSNVFLFLLTIIVSLGNLPADRISGQVAIQQILQQNQAKMTDSERQALKGMEIPGGDGQGGVLEQVANDLTTTMRKSLAYKYASENVRTEEQLKVLYQIKNVDSTYVLEPHYSVLNLLAYRPAEASIPGKLLGLIGSMFLHGSFAHLISNMIFLFVFGRALEDTLGPRVYLGAYLLCGLAAALLHHAIGMLLTPEAMYVPYLGASGAIGGVLGLFALRFYRTTTTLFIGLPLLIAAMVLYVVTLLVTGNISLLLKNLMSGNESSLETIYAFLLVITFIAVKPDRLAPTLKIASAWAVGLWVVVFNVLPILQQLVNGGSDGTAYWAHIGGFLLGSIYGLLIGSKEEGKQEFLLEDAERAYGMGDVPGAISYSQNVLEREPNNPVAYEVMAKSFMKQNSENEALDHFEMAIRNYMRIGERQKAAAAYLTAVEKYTTFILQPSEQLAVGNQMAKDFDYKNAAETLVKIPYTFPDAGEGEVALLRAAQIYVQHLGEPQVTLQLLQFFWQKYPESQWMPQVERAWKTAEYQISAAQQASESAGPGAQHLELAPKRTQKIPPSAGR
jgi:membrane associated rhomboid family serine protease